MSEEMSVQNPLRFSDKEFETIENLAACNYSLKNMAIYLDVNVAQFQEAYLDISGKVRHHYDKGVLSASFEKDSKMLENAKSGNITAYQESNKAQEKRAFENHKNRILNEI